MTQIGSSSMPDIPSNTRELKLMSGQVNLNTKLPLKPTISFLNSSVSISDKTSKEVLPNHPSVSQVMMLTVSLMISMN
jgi:hypothetical protein